MRETTGHEPDHEPDHELDHELDHEPDHELDHGPGHHRDREPGHGIVYKLLPAAEWEQARADGVFRGSPVDVADGYIHFSTRAQLAETARRHFAGRTGLVLLAVAAEALGADLRWEPARDGSLFPHLYAGLPVSAVTAAAKVPGTGEDGVGAALARLGE